MRSSGPLPAWGAGGLTTVAALAVVLAAACTPDAPSDPDLVVLRGVTVVDGTGAPPATDRTVVVRDGRIETVGPVSEVELPAGATVVDGEGRYLVPGLIDLHVHLSKARRSALPLFVVHGVTSVRDVGSEWEEVRAWRAAARRGELVAPRIRTSGPYLEARANVERMRAARARGEMVEPVERTRIPVDSPERARAVVDSVAALGVDFVKFRTVPSMATYLAIAEAADGAGLDLAGHTFGIPLDRVVSAGQETVEHFPFPVMDDLAPGERRAIFRAMADSGTAIVPTLVTWELSTLAEDPVLRAMLADTAGRRWPERRYLSRYLEEDWKEQMAERGGEGGPDWEAIHRATLRNLREMHRAGVRVLPGSDVAVLGIFPGDALHTELELLVDQVGLTPLEALTAATGHAAEVLHMEDSVGTVEPGKRADLLLLGADPTADIANTRRIDAVLLRGRLLDRTALDSLRRSVLRSEELDVVDWR